MASVGSESIEQTESYADIFERCGVQEEYRSPEHYFFAPNPTDGVLYPIPREISINGITHNLHENGAAVNKRATLGEGVRLGSRAVIGMASIDNEASIGSGCTIGDRVQIGEKASLRYGTLIDNGSSIGITSDVGPEAHLESGVEVGNFTSIGKFVMLGTEAWVDNDVRIGGNSKLGQRVRVHEGAVIESGVCADEFSVILDNAKVGVGSRIMAHEVVGKRRTIRPHTLVYSTRYKRARKSSSR